MRVRSFFAAALAAMLLLSSVGVSAAAATSGTLWLTQSMTLRADHFGNVMIQTNNVTLDCAGHTIHGPGLTDVSGGIDLAFASNVTVRRCIVSGFVHNGLFGHHGTNIRLNGNTFVANGNHGIHLDAVSDSAVLGNTARGNGVLDPAVGIVVTRSDDVTIQTNTASDNRSAGIALVGGTTESNVVGNTANQNEGGVVVGDLSTNNTFAGNTANANGNGFVAVDGATGNTFTNNIANGNEYMGFQITTDVNTLVGNTANGNNDGFSLYGADGNVLTGNIANSNRNYGFVVSFGSSNNTLTDNTGLNNAYFDAWEEGTGTGDTWFGNTFRTTFGL